MVSRIVEESSSVIFGWSLKGPFLFEVWRLLGAGVLGHSLGALRHGVLGQLTGEQQADGGLDLPGGDGGPLVVMSETRGLTGDALEDVVDEGVHDSHRLGGDTGVGVDLLQHLVHVDGIALLPGLSALLAALNCGFGDGFLGALFGGGLGCWIRHDETRCEYCLWCRPA